EWVYRRFIVEGPSAGRVYVQAVFEDNPHLDLVSYEESLRELPPGIREQLRFGDWLVRPQGGLFKREWFTARFIEHNQVPPELRLCRFWDLAASEQVAGSDPDFTAGVLLGRDPDGIFYLIDVVRTRATPLGVQQLVKRIAEKDRVLVLARDWRLPAIRMEQEPGAAGKAIIDVYARLVLQPFDFKGTSSTGSKEARAAPVSARAEAGHLLICRGRWNGELLDELCAFPYVRHDDQVDALSGAYAELAENEGRRRTRITKAIIGEPASRSGGRRGFVDPPPPPHRSQREGGTGRRG
ncbi:MAG TPA: phage terminase large subunit, partial [Gemmatimonadales bacterium]|nr:phage terminase large subunit [Gemmatimonadales bacterium]